MDHEIADIWMSGTAVMANSKRGLKFIQEEQGSTAYVQAKDRQILTILSPDAFKLRAIRDNVVIHHF